jgi:hypothetical protein
MGPREVRIHDAGQHLAPSFSLRQVLERVARPLGSEPHGLGEDGLLRLELGVERSVREAGHLGDRVDARAVDASLPKLAGRRRQDSPPVIGRPLFRCVHEKNLLRARNPA